MSSFNILNKAWYEWNVDNNNMRFGQYVISQYTPSNYKNPNIFYEKSAELAYEILWLEIALSGMELIEKQ